MRLGFAPVDKQHPKRVALTYGPVVLVRPLSGRLVATAGEPDKWIAPHEKPLDFRAKRREDDTFTPFYRMTFDRPYEMYFDLL